MCISILGISVDIEGANVSDTVSEVVSVDALTSTGDELVETSGITQVVRLSLIAFVKGDVFVCLKGDVVISSLVFSSTILLALVVNSSEGDMLLAVGFTFVIAVIKTVYFSLTVGLFVTPVESVG